MLVAYVHMSSCVVMIERPTEPRAWWQRFWPFMLKRDRVPHAWLSYVVLPMSPTTDTRP